MLIAVVSVAALIWLALGRRESAVVLIAIPVTLALTLFVFYLYGYTLNRITLFALIFSIGILVDDAIVVVENIVRHARMHDRDEPASTAVAMRAVDEVGNPTILATFTVIAAILPMAFVGGLMGPYMRPIPVGASAAMLFSLAVAFIVTPWAAVRLLRGAARARTRTEDDWLTRALPPRRWARSSTPRRACAGLPRRRRASCCVAAAALVPLRLVTVKMLPFDNKSELQVDRAHARRHAARSDGRASSSALADDALDDAAVTDVQSYAGIAAPYNFNGLVRHYFLRRAPHLARSAGESAPTRTSGREQSHDDCAAAPRRACGRSPTRSARAFRSSRCRPARRCCRRWWPRSTAPTASAARGARRQVRERLRANAGVVDVDWYVDTRGRCTALERGQRARRRPPACRARTWRQSCGMAGAGDRVGLLHDPLAREDGADRRAPAAVTPRLAR